jgi:hypothetical protein
MPIIWTLPITLQVIWWTLVTIITSHEQTTAVCSSCRVGDGTVIGVHNRAPLVTEQRQLDAHAFIFYSVLCPYRGRLPISTLACMLTSLSFFTRSEVWISASLRCAVMSRVFHPYCTLQVYVVELQNLTEQPSV